MAETFTEWIGEDHGDRVLGRVADHGWSAHHRRIRGSAPSAAKARTFGTDGKLGAGGLRGTTASAYTQSICRSAERQALLSMSARSAAAAAAVDALELI